MIHFCWIVLTKVCLITNRKPPQDGSNITHNLSDNSSSANPVCWHDTEVSVERITYSIWYVGTEADAAVQHIHCSCVAGVKSGWQKLVYTKTGCSASSPQELAHTHTTTFTSFIHTQSTLKKCSRRTNCVQTHCTSVTTKAAMFINQECTVAAKGR